MFHVHKKIFKLSLVDIYREKGGGWKTERQREKSLDFIKHCCNRHGDKNWDNKMKKNTVKNIVMIKHSMIVKSFILFNKEHSTRCFEKVWSFSSRTACEMLKIIMSSSSSMNVSVAVEDGYWTLYRDLSV